MHGGGFIDAICCTTNADVTTMFIFPTATGAAIKNVELPVVTPGVPLHISTLTVMESHELKR